MRVMPHPARTHPVPVPLRSQPVPRRPPLGGAGRDGEGRGRGRGWQSRGHPRPPWGHPRPSLPQPGPARNPHPGGHPGPRIPSQLRDPCPGTRAGHPKDCHLPEPRCRARTSRGMLQERPWAGSGFPKDTPAPARWHLRSGVWKDSPSLVPRAGSQRMPSPHCPQKCPISSVKNRIPKCSPFPVSGTGPQRILQSQCQELGPKGIPIPSVRNRIPKDSPIPLPRPGSRRNPHPTQPGWKCSHNQLQLCPEFPEGISGLHPTGWSGCFCPKSPKSWDIQSQSRAGSTGAAPLRLGIPPGSKTAPEQGWRRK